MGRDLWWAFVAVAVACLWLAVAAVLAARRPLEPAELAAWASGHDLECLPDRWLEPAARYLRRSRLSRTVGGAVPFVAGTVAPALWAATQGLPTPWPLALFGVRTWLAGYLIGVLVAEYRWTRPRSGVVRSAALVPRRLGDYLPVRAVIGMRLAALAVAALVPLLAWGPLTPVPVRELVLGGRGGALATATLALAAAAAVEVTVRRLVGRPQPATDSEELAVDDALSSTSVHAVAGAGLAIVLLSLSVQVGLVAANLGGGPGRTAVVALSWGCAAAAVAAWARVGHPRRWAVRRVLARDAGRLSGA